MRDGTLWRRVPVGARLEGGPVHAQGILPERGARILAEIEHVPARIDLQLDTLVGP